MALTVVWVPALVIAHALGVSLLIYALEQSLGLVSWSMTASRSQTERQSDSDRPILPSLTSVGRAEAVVFLLFSLHLTSRLVLHSNFDTCNRESKHQPALLTV